MSSVIYFFAPKSFVVRVSSGRHLMHCLVGKVVLPTKFSKACDNFLVSVWMDDFPNCDSILFANHFRFQFRFGILRNSLTGMLGAYFCFRFDRLFLAKTRLAHFLSGFLRGYTS